MSLTPLDRDVLDALVELCAAVGSHPDAMTKEGSLHAAFLKASAVAIKHSPPSRELTNVIEVPM